MISPNGAILINPGAPPLATRATRDNRFNDWLTGILSFSSSPIKHQKLPLERVSYTHSRHIFITVIIVAIRLTVAQINHRALAKAILDTSRPV